MTPPLPNSAATLGQLVDLDAFREICLLAARLYATGISLLDHQGDTLVRVGPEEEQGEDTAGRIVRPFDHGGVPLGSIVVGPLGRVPEVVGAQVAALLERVLSSLVAAWAARTAVAGPPAAGDSETTLPELVAQNERLYAMVERLKDVERVKSSFLATMSHELRTPLTSVIGYAEMLIQGLAGDLSPPQQEYVRTIREKGDQLLSLISGILEISKLEAGTITLKPQSVPLGPLVEEAIGMLSGTARGKSVALECAVTSPCPPAMADRDRLRQALLAVVDNAVKFTPQGGSVKVAVRSVEGTPEMVEVTVKDTGVGIPEHALPHVFEAFYQADSSPTRPFGGAGLGLALARSLMVAQGGSIAAESCDGQGTTVTLRLPACTEPAAPHEESPRAS
jgi:signal transduction histidine kinase